MLRNLSVFLACTTLSLCSQLQAADDELPIRRVEEVIEVFQTNQAAVDEDYLNKKMHITGEVLKITRVDAKDKGETEYVVRVMPGSPGMHWGRPMPGVAYAVPATTVAPGYSSSGYVAHPNAVAAANFLDFRFTAKHRAQLAELRTGRTVTFEAVCKGEQGDASAKAIGFDTSRIIKVHESPRPATGEAGGSNFGTPTFSPYAPTTPVPAIPPMAIPAPRF